MFLRISVADPLVQFNFDQNKNCRAFKELSIGIKHIDIPTLRYNFNKNPNLGNDFKLKCNKLV